MEKEGLKVPSSTWTYLIDNRPEQLGIRPMQLALDPFSVILTTINLALYRGKKNRENKTVKLKKKG
jgi:hypothetical protein